MSDVVDQAYVSDSFGICKHTINEEHKRQPAIIENKDDIDEDNDDKPIYEDAFEALELQFTSLTDAYAQYCSRDDS